AGTMHPATFLRALVPEPWRVAFVQPSRRPADGRYGENPNRLFKHYQYQVVLKPSPDDIQDRYLRSLVQLGIRLREHDVRFLEDDWEAPTLGASGLGWQVFLDGAEISQFTYFQQMGGLEAKPVSVEITYGLERITMFIQRRSSAFEIEWAPGMTYGELRLQDEAGQEGRVPDLLLEIGTEELPPHDIAPALQQLAEGMRAALAALRIDAGVIRTYGAPRRLAVVCMGVASRQRPMVREVRGPAAQA